MGMTYTVKDHFYNKKRKKKCFTGLSMHRKGHMFCRADQTGFSSNQLLPDGK